MHPKQLDFFARLLLAFVLPWKILFDGLFAARVRALPEASPAEAADPAPALQLLALLQREGRFVDFLQEDVSAFSDADIGGAARVVHEGCKRALKETLVLEPVRKEAEGAQVVLEPGFDAARTRLTGNVAGQPPYKGRLAHHGWQALQVRLPTLTSGHDPKVIAPAEVEL